MILSTLSANNQAYSLVLSAYTLRLGDAQHSAYIMLVFGSVSRLGLYLATAYSAYICLYTLRVVIPPSFHLSAYTHIERYSAFLRGSSSQPVGLYRRSRIIFALRGSICMAF